MSPENIMSISYQALKVGLAIAAPLLLAALISGLLISLLQAATQINETTLSFIPKILSVLLALVCAGPWMLSVLTDYMKTMFTHFQWFIS